MSPAWIAFARTGSPNAPGLPSWPRYDTRSRSTMIYNVVSRAVNDPYAEERSLSPPCRRNPRRGLGRLFSRRRPGGLRHNAHRRRDLP